jgi:hypothetical protein
MNELTGCVGSNESMDEGVGILDGVDLEAGDTQPHTGLKYSAL